MYLNANKTLICNTEIEINKVYFLRLYTKYLTWFLKYSIELIVALSSTNTTKKPCWYFISLQNDHILAQS